MNDAIVQTLIDEFMKESYDWEFGGKIVTIEDAKRILCRMFNVDTHKITIKKTDL